MGRKYRRTETVAAAVCPACVDRGEPMVSAGKVARLKSDGTLKPDGLGRPGIVFASLRCPKCNTWTKWRVPDLIPALEAGGTVTYETHSVKMVADWRLQMGVDEPGLNAAVLGRVLRRAVEAGKIKLE